MLEVAIAIERNMPPVPKSADAVDAEYEGGEDCWAAAAAAAALIHVLERDEPISLLISLVFTSFVVELDEVVEVPLLSVRAGSVGFPLLLHFERMSILGACERCFVV